MSNKGTEEEARTGRTAAGFIPDHFVLECCRNLSRALLAGWPRRSRSMLVMPAGSGAFLETMWEAGFNVTGQYKDLAGLEAARLQLGSRVDLVLSAPEHLPFDDRFFDYAVVIALELWEDPEAVFREIGRVSCGGLILIFPSAWSLFGLECRLRGKKALCAAIRPLLRSPRKLSRLLHRVYDDKKIVWASMLPGPSATWTGRSWLQRVNALCLHLPAGAFAGLRVDFGPEYTGTPTPLRAPDPVASGNL